MSRLNTLFVLVCWIWSSDILHHGTNTLAVMAQNVGDDESVLRTTKKTIAVIEFMQETNSFSPVPTHVQNFESHGKDGLGSLLWYTPDEIWTYITTKETNGHVAGFVKGVQDQDTAEEYTMAPLLQARSVSGGPLTAEAYNHFEEHIMKGLEHLVETSSLQGIYLSLHGAMGVEGRTDPEGDLVERIRTLVGATLPIGVTHDLHANLTRKRMRLITFLLGYRTNPHRDYYSVSYQAGKIMAQTLQGKVRPTMAYQKMRLLKGGGWTMDFMAPMRQIFQWMTRQEKNNANVLALSTFMVHLWLDHEELGWATVAVTNNDEELAERLSVELADLNWNARDAYSPSGISPAEALEQTKDLWISRYFGTTIWCDVSDSVGAGAPGESTWILRTLLDHQKAVETFQLSGNRNDTTPQPLVSYLTIRDSEAIEQVFDASVNIGDTVTLQVGGKLDFVTNQPVAFSGTVVKRVRDSFEGHGDNTDSGGRIAIVEKDGIHLIINEVPTPLHSPAYLTQVLGLSLWQADIVVVKNIFPFRYRYLLYNRRTFDVVTPGVTNINVFDIPYTKIPRPIYPLDKDIMDQQKNQTLSWRLEFKASLPDSDHQDERIPTQDKDSLRGVEL